MSDPPLPSDFSKFLNFNCLLKIQVKLWFLVPTWWAKDRDKDTDNDKDMDQDRYMGHERDRDKDTDKEFQLDKLLQITMWQ